MRCGIRAVALSLLVSVALSSLESTALADAEVPREPELSESEAEAPSEATEPVSAPTFTFLLDLGPTFGWYAGGHVGFGFAFRMTELTSLVVSPRLAGGAGWDDNPFVVMGGDVGVRVRRMAEVSGVGHVGVGVNYLVEIEGPRTDYLYVAPHLRFGGGIRKGSDSKRFGWGVEGTTRLGYAFDVTDHAIELTDADYGGVYGVFEVALVMEF